MNGDAPPANERDWRPGSNPWAIAIAVTMAAFMEVLDTTIVNVALPHIAGSMSAGQDESTWVLTSYLVANGIVLPVAGFLGRLLGRKRYFVICIAAFTVASLACGLATNLTEIIIFRLLQGFFGGGLQPNQQSIILDTFPPQARGRAFAITAMATIVAPVLGPTLGGWVTDNYSWRWIFFINVPVGVIAVLAVSQLVEDPPWIVRQMRDRPKIDFIGLGLIALGLGCLQITLDRGEDDDWLGSSFIRLFAVLTVLGLMGAVLWLLYAKNPIVRLRVLADRNLATGCLMIFAMAGILFSSAVLLPQLAQRQLGYTATWAGLILSPGALTLTVLVVGVSRLLPYVPGRYLVGFGFFALGLSLLYSHGLTPQIDFATLASMRIAQTFGLGFLFVPISTLTYVTIHEEDNGDATALNVMFRNIGGAIGISVATSLVTERGQVHMAYLAEHLTPYGQAYPDLLGRVRQVLTDHGGLASGAAGQIYQMLQNQAAILAYMDVFQYCAVLAFLTVPLCLLFSPVKAHGGAGLH